LSHEKLWRETIALRRRWQRMSRYFLIAMAGGLAALIALLLGLGPFSSRRRAEKELSPANYISIPD
jgi:hypothetical protein